MLHAVENFSLEERKEKVITVPFMDGDILSVALIRFSKCMNVLLKAHFQQGKQGTLGSFYNREWSTDELSHEGNIWKN